MHSALIAVCCALAGLQPPLAQNWSDTSLIAADDDWSGVAAIVGYRGDGLVVQPGTDARDVLADGSDTPLDVAANRTDPGAFGLAAGVAEFELANPVVALRGSATASAPQLVMALDTRGREGIVVRMRLRDIDDSADAVEQVALQYRVGGTGDFANVPGGYVADATSAAPPIGEDSAGTDAAADERVTALRVVLPAAADDRRLVEVRVMTTDAAGRDEWVGVDDIDITATAVADPVCKPPSPQPAPWREDPPTAPPPAIPPAPSPAARPRLTDLALLPSRFRPAGRGPAILRRGRAGAALGFRLSRPAIVRFRVTRRGEWLGFQARGHRGLNRMRFTGRVQGRALADGAYALRAVAIAENGLETVPITIRFRIARPQG
jgi:hypothetical protein